MAAKKPRIVIVGAGMAGLAAANKLFTATGSKELFELLVVEGGERIGGRINTSEFGGERIEMGATWIHGIDGSPIYKMAEEIRALQSEQPWECMDGFSDEQTTIAEGGFELSSSIVEPISNLFKNLMNFSQGKKMESNGASPAIGDIDYFEIAEGASKICSESVSVGSFLRKGLDLYWVWKNKQMEFNGSGGWEEMLLEEAIFAMNENIQRTYTSAGDLFSLDYNAESEYRMFPGEEITIAKGYSTIIKSLASVLPPGLVQLGKKVSKIEWQPESMENTHFSRPVKLHFSDGSTLSADHVIVTVSLGVLKAGIQKDFGFFSPPLPSFKTEAISKLGYGVVNKLFVQLGGKETNLKKFPNLYMAFQRPESEFGERNIPWWMRRTAFISPIHQNSSVLLSWFAGNEALQLEKLSREEIMNGVSTTVSSFLSKPHRKEPSSIPTRNGNVSLEEVKFGEVLTSKWGTDPLFLGSYSYVAVGSSGEDLDKMAEPVPEMKGEDSAMSCPLQILFAGEATHRTHYSTTHGAYFSGLREANRLLQHYNWHHQA